MTLPLTFYPVSDEFIYRSLNVAPLLSPRADGQPMTFSGSSYVRWRMTVPMERRLNLRLELRTVQSHARLMHAVGRVDYSILEVTV